MSKLLGSSGLVQEVMEAEWWQPRLVRVCGKLWNPAMIEHLRADEVSAPWDASEEDAESVSWNPLNVCTDLSTIDMLTIEELMTKLEVKASPSVRRYLSRAFSDTVIDGKLSIAYNSLIQCNHENMCKLSCVIYRLAHAFYHKIKFRISLRF